MPQVEFVLTHMGPRIIDHDYNLYYAWRREKREKSAHAPPHELAAGGPVFVPALVTLVARTLALLLVSASASEGASGGLNPRVCAGAPVGGVWPTFWTRPAAFEKRRAVGHPLSPVSPRRSSWWRSRARRLPKKQCAAG